MKFNTKRNINIPPGYHQNCSKTIVIFITKLNYVITGINLVIFSLVILCLLNYKFKL